MSQPLMASCCTSFKTNNDCLLKIFTSKVFYIFKLCTYTSVECRWQIDIIQPSINMYCMFSLKQIDGDKVLSMSHVLISIRMKTNINTFYTVTSSIQTIKEKKTTCTWKALNYDMTANSGCSCLIVNCVISAFHWMSAIS